jgi:hypothetical protein
MPDPQPQTHAGSAVSESITSLSLSLSETADRHGDAVLEAKVERLRGKTEEVKEVVRPNAINAEMMNEDKQISLTDPDARSMATNGKAAFGGLSRRHLVSQVKRAVRSIGCKRDNRHDLR